MVPLRGQSGAPSESKAEHRTSRTSSGGCVGGDRVGGGDGGGGVG